ncbi:MFS transporter [Streptomyces sp. NPDC000941]
MAADTAAQAERKRWLSLYTLCAGTLMIVLDGSVVTVALPTIGRELHFSQSNLAWLVNAYMIAFGGLLLLSGRLGDLLGRKRMFLAGVTLFTAASLLCGLSNSQELLIFGRFVQGVGGAMASAVTLGMIVTMFLAPRDQAKAIGVFSFVAAAGGSIGVIAGGVLTEAAGWNSIFFINVPIGAVILLAASRLFEPDRGLGFGAGADLVGAVLVTSGLMLLVFAINKIENDGLGSAQTLGFGALALVLLAGFVLRQAKASNPLLPLRIFRSRSLSGANGVMVLFVAGLFGFQFLLAIYLQSVAGYSSVRTGMAYLPGPIVIAVISLGYSAKIITRFGPRAVLLVGMVITAVALALLGRLPVRVLPCRRPAVRAAARHRRGPLAPRRDGAGHVRCDARRLGPRLGSGQHHAADRRRPRRGDPGRTGRLPGRHPGQPGQEPRRGRDRRLPRLLSRGRSPGGRGRASRRRRAARAEDRHGPRRRDRAGRRGHRPALPKPELTTCPRAV